MSSLGYLLDDSIRRHVEESGRAYNALYGPEFLTQSGLSFSICDIKQVLTVNPTCLWISGSGPWPQDASSVLEQYVASGGYLIITGDIARLGFVTERPARASRSFPVGYLELSGTPQEFGRSRCLKFPVRQAFSRSDIKPGEAWGELLDQDGQPTGTAGVTVIHHERGTVLWIPVDLCECVLQFQQGTPVIADGHPAPDGLAQINDGILKCDDGAVARWEDREVVDGTPAYLRAPVEWLRDLLVRTIWWGMGKKNKLAPQVWYWPQGAPAVATLSFDTDSNEGKHAWLFMEHLASLGVVGTWCVMYPGGYEKEVYQALTDRGHEIALHFEAFSEEPNCDWSYQSLKKQHQWLGEETGVKKAYSQKNHLTRWEGVCTFFRWLEQEGIRVDQSRGPSKQGNMGFLFGTSRLWRPLDDPFHDYQLLNVYESSFLTVDMYGGINRAPLRRRLLDAAVETYSVAHFLFHPQRIVEDGMKEGIADIVYYGKERQLNWWTSESLGKWEDLRRGVAIAETHDGWIIESEHDLQGLTLLLPCSDGIRFELDGSELAAAVKERHGVKCQQLVFDLTGQVSRRLRAI